MVLRLCALAETSAEPAGLTLGLLLQMLLPQLGPHEHAQSSHAPIAACNSWTTTLGAKVTMLLACCRLPRRASQ